MVARHIHPVREHPCRAAATSLQGGVVEAAVGGPSAVRRRRDGAVVGRQTTELRRNAGRRRRQGGGADRRSAAGIRVHRLAAWRADAINTTPTLFQFRRVVTHVAVAPSQQVLPERPGHAAAAAACPWRRRRWRYRLRSSCTRWCRQKASGGESISSEYEP